MTSRDLESLVQDLETHQIELEMQNEELRRTQVELARVRDRYRDLYEFAPVGYLTLDGQGKIRQVNLATAHLNGLDPLAMADRRIEVLFDVEARNEVYLLLRSVASKGQQEDRELRLNRDPERWVRLVVAPLFEPDPGFRAAMIDVTDRKLAERELRDIRADLESRVAARTAEISARVQQLRALASQMTLLEQQERRRMARILHDHHQQLLVAAKFRAASLRRHDDSEVRKSSSAIEALLEDAIENSRNMTTELSPPILQESGLEPALEWLARWMADKHGLNVELAIECELPPLPEDVRILLFESIRELLFNTVKHAGVTTARVAVTLEEPDFCFTVSDSGAGFDPGRVQPPGSSKGGFGLFAIRERLNRIKGRLGIESASGRGSRFILSIPARELAIDPEIPAPSPRKSDRGRKLLQIPPPRPGARIRVLLADDHAVMREGLAELLGRESDMVIVGQASDGIEATHLAAILLPDVILMDLGMPRMGGLEATQIIHRDHPDIRIIGLSMHDEADKSQSMRKAGAVVYVSKSDPPDRLIGVVRDCGRTTS